MWPILKSNNVILHISWENSHLASPQMVCIFLLIYIKTYIIYWCDKWYIIAKALITEGIAALYNAERKKTCIKINESAQRLQQYYSKNQHGVYSVNAHDYNFCQRLSMFIFLCLCCTCMCGWGFVGVRWHTVSTYCTVLIIDILWILAVVSHWFTVYQIDVF